MKKTLLTFVLLLAAAFSLSAQDYFLNSNGYEYLPKQTKIVNDPASPCNQGGESFLAFIKKWNSDLSFRKTRVKVTSESFNAENVEEAKEMLLSQLEWIKDSKVDARPTYEENGCDLTCTYFAVSADKVGYRVDAFPTDPDPECGGSTSIYGFQRVGGKWYLVYLMLLG